MYKMYMLNTDPERYVDALETIESHLLGARLEIARLYVQDADGRRQYPTKQDAIRAMQAASDDPSGFGERIYYCHEAGDPKRRPKMPRLRFYADFYGVPLSYLLLGEDAETYETEVREMAAARGISLRIDTWANSVDDASVNQDFDSIESNPIHNQEPRYRVILTASEIRHLSTGRGDLTAMSGPTLLVPDFLEVSRQSFWYRLPQSDVSMTGQAQSFNPGGIGLFDRDARILPGDFVLADLDVWDEPVLRRYVAARAYSPGAPFKLDALNPAYEPIEVPAQGECRLIARLMFFGNRF